MPLQDESVEFTAGVVGSVEVASVVVVVEVVVVSCLVGTIGFPSQNFSSLPSRQSISPSQTLKKV